MLSILVCLQVHHYGCVIKSGTIDRVIAGQMRLLALFVTLGKIKHLSDKHDYPTALSTNIQLMMWLRRRKHPVYNLIAADIMMLNEELGELSFSVLARGMHGNPIRGDVKLVSKNYVLTRERMSIAKEMGLEFASPDLMGKAHKKEGKGANVIKQEDIDLAAAHFKGVLREMAGGQWRPVAIDGLRSRKNTGVNQNDFRKILDMKMKDKAVLWDPAIETKDMTRVQSRAGKALTNQGKPWVFMPVHGLLWNEFKPDDEPDDDNLGDLNPDDLESWSDQEEIEVPVQNKRKRRRVARKQASESEDDDEEKSKNPKRPKKSKNKSKSSKSRSSKKKTASKHKGASKNASGSDDENSAEWFRPKMIRQERCMENTDELQFLVEWQGHPHRDAMTWEPSEYFMEEFPDLTNAWFRTRGASQQ